MNAIRRVLLGHAYLITVAHGRDILARAGDELTPVDETRLDAITRDLRALENGSLRVAFRVLTFAR